MTDNFSLQSWTSTGYFSNSTGSFVTNCRFYLIIAWPIYIYRERERHGCIFLLSWLTVSVCPCAWLSYHFLPTLVGRIRTHIFIFPAPGGSFSIPPILFESGLLHYYYRSAAQNKHMNGSHFAFRGLFDPHPQHLHWTFHTCLGNHYSLAFKCFLFYYKVVNSQRLQALKDIDRTGGEGRGVLNMIPTVACSSIFPNV